MGESLRNVGAEALRGLPGGVKTRETLVHRRRRCSMSTACIVLASPHGPAPQCVYPRCVADTPNYCEPVHGCETAVGRL